MMYEKNVVMLQVHDAILYAILACIHRTHELHTNIAREDCIHVLHARIVCKVGTQVLYAKFVYKSTPRIFLTKFLFHQKVGYRKFFQPLLKSFK